MKLTVLFLLSCVGFPFSSCGTVSLIPMGILNICPNEFAYFACRTTKGALVWETKNGGFNQAIFNKETQPDSDIGIFRVSVHDVIKDENGTIVQVDSSARTLVGVQPEYNDTRLSCFVLINSQNSTRNDVFLRVAGAPPAPFVTSRKSSQSISTSLQLMINWTNSDCAVQYVVTIINSSDGSVYSNITTSDTNTTVTLPNDGEYCVTVVAQDGVGRRGQDSEPLCYDNTPPIISPTSSVSVSTSTTSSTFIEPGTSNSSLPTPRMQETNVTVILAVLLALALIAVFALIISIFTIIIFLKRKLTNRNQAVRHEPDVELKAVSNSTDQSPPVDSSNNTDQSPPVDSSDSTVESDLSNMYSTVESPPVQDLSLEQIQAVVKEQVQAASHTTQQQIQQVVEVAIANAFPRPAQSSQEPKVLDCIFQVFFQQLAGRNNWKFLLTILPRKHLSALTLFNNMKKYGKSHDFQLNLDNMTDDDVTLNICHISDGWNLQKESLTLSKTAVKQYNGDRKPPHCVVIVKAAEDDVTPSDLSFTVNFNGLQNFLPITVEDRFEAQNVVKCSAQVFYKSMEERRWKIFITFFPTEKLKQVKNSYQDTNVGSHHLLQFSGGIISVNPEYMNEAGWTVLPVQLHEVETIDIERFDGNGKPPCCELEVKAATDDHGDLELPVTLTGVKSPKSITLERRFVHPDAASDLAKSVAADKRYTCQVFYKKTDANANHWTATFAFFPNDKTDVVRSIYHDQNIGPTIAVEFSRGTYVPGFAQTAIKPVIVKEKETKDKGWKVYRDSDEKKQIYREYIENYSSEDKPPHFKIIIAPLSDKIPSDHIKQTIEITGVNSPNVIVLERAIETDERKA